MAQAAENDGFAHYVREHFADFLEQWSSEPSASLDTSGTDNDARFDYLEQVAAAASSYAAAGLCCSCRANALRAHTSCPQCKTMRDDDRTTLYVDFQHLEQHSVELADAIVSEFYYLEAQLRVALHGVMSRHHPEAVMADKEYTVSFYNMSTLLRVRDMKSDCVGKLLRHAPLSVARRRPPHQPCTIPTR